MNIKNTYNVVLSLCGLILTVSGIICVVIGSLLNYHQPNEVRSFGTQNWLGFPLLLCGVITMFFAVLYKTIKTIKHIVILFCLYIPVIILSFVGSILHGASYVYIVSTEVTSLSDIGYICEDITNTNQCECVNKETQDRKFFAKYFCDKLTTLLQFHGAIFSFAAISHGTLLCLLVINIIFLFHLLTRQLPVNISNVENEGFTEQTEDNAIHRTPSTPVPENEDEESQYGHNVSENEVHPSRELPPSYDSLLLTFNRTGATAVSRNISGHAPASRGAPVVNRQARVSYRGEMNSGANPFPETRGTSPQTTLHEITMTQNTENSFEQRNHHDADETTVANEEATVNREEDVEDGLATHEHQEDSSTAEYVDAHLNNSNDTSSPVHSHPLTNSNHRGPFQTRSERSSSQETPDSTNLIINNEINTEYNVGEHGRTPTETLWSGATIEQDSGNDIEHQSSPQSSVNSTSDENTGDSDTEHETPQTSSDQNTDDDVEHELSPPETTW